MTVHRSDSVSIKEEVAVAAAKAAVPISVSGGLIFGIHIGLAIQWATLIFLILQISLILRKHVTYFLERWQERKRRNNGGGQCS